MKKVIFFLWRWVRSDWGGWPVWHYGRADGAGALMSGWHDSAAGHMISFYAFGVVLETRLLAALFSSRFSLKHILLFLVTLCVMGNAILPFPRAS